jgi:hypothetical protein
MEAMDKTIGEMNGMPNGLILLEQNFERNRSYSIEGSSVGDALRIWRLVRACSLSSRPVGWVALRCRGSTPRSAPPEAWYGPWQIVRWGAAGLQG